MLNIYQMSSKKIDLGIASDQEAAKEYNKILDELEEFGIIRKLSNDEEVNLLGFFNGYGSKKKLAGLPKEELEFIKEAFAKVAISKGRLGVLKRKAFKINSTGGHLKSMLEPIKAKLFDMMGSLYANEEIKKNLEDSGMHVSNAQIETFRIKHRGEISKLQDAYEKEWHTVGISRKRARLDQLAYIYGSLKDQFEITKKSEKMLAYQREMVKTLEQVRKEVEGDRIKLDIYGKIDITSTLEINQSVEEMYANINFMNLLIGRAASRLGINPLELHYRLTNSWYCKFTGMKRNTGMYDEAPPYPSDIIKNWSEVEDAYVISEKKLDVIREKYVENDMDEKFKETNFKKNTLKELLEERRDKLR
jgi:hypothetical protein